MKFLFAALAFSSALMPLSVHAAATDAELIALSPNASSCSGVTGKQIIGTISRLSSFIHLSGPAVQLIVVTSTGARPLMVYNAGVSVSMQPMAHYELERMLLLATATGSRVVACVASDNYSLLGIDVLSQ
jgi:hypothetical protein